MKKALSLLLCAVMLMGMLPMSVFAASGNYITITADKTEVLPGDEVVFNVTAESVDACETFGLLLEFDRDVFEFVKGSATASYLNADEEELVGVKSFNKEAGKEGIAVSFLEAVVYSGKVGKFTLKVKDDAVFTETVVTAKTSALNVYDSVEFGVNPVTLTALPVETEAPTEAPTEEPTEAPTEEPTEAPTEEPTEAPTEAPTEEPTEPSSAPNSFIFTPDKTEVLPGDEVKITVTAEMTEACDQFGLIFDFDRDVFEFVKGAAQATYLNEDEEEQVAVKTFNKTSGLEGIAVSFLGDVVYSGKVGYITLKVKEGVNFAETKFTAAYAVRNDTTSLQANVPVITIAMHAHNYVAVVTEPTCVEAGYTTYTCSCGDEYVADEVAATGHSLEHYDAVEATCDTDGHEAFDYCTVCECFFYEDALKLSYQDGVIPALGHAWVTYEAVAPTCEGEGNIAYQQCSTCGAAQTADENPVPLSKFGWVLAAAGHSLEHYDAVEATCDTDGHEAFDYCTACECFFYADPLKLTYQAGVIPALGHTWVDYAAVAPSCEAVGNIAYQQCSVCGAAQTADENPVPLSKDGWILGATGHSLEHYDAVEATCDTDGHEAFDYCAECECFFYADPLKLSYQDGVIPALGHAWVEHAAVEPTCDTEGNIAYQLCSTCGAAQTAGENPMPLAKYGWILAATGHAWVDVEAVAPTCEADGNIAYQYCSTCGAAQTAGENPMPLAKYGWVLGATGHSLEHYDAVEATCDTDGHEAFDYCTACECFFYEDPLKLTYQAGIILATGHTWVDVEAVEPTCDMDGNIAYQYCSVCGAAQTAGENPMPLAKYGWVLGATGHTWVDVEAVEPTCDTEGNIAYQYCSVCGAAQTAGENPMPLTKYGWVLAALGHNWTNFEAVAPGCLTEGNIAYQVCETCGAAQTWDENPMPLSRYGWIVGATGHNYVDGKCENCGDYPGDINGDGKLDNDDVVYLLWHTLFGAEQNPAYADPNVNKDEVVDNDDVLYLLWRTLFGEDQFPLLDK